MISEFDMLMPINNSHIRKIEIGEIKTKYEYLIAEIDIALAHINNTKLNMGKYPGAESYIYLDIIYRIDYLIKPEGNIMEIIDNVHNLYFYNKIKTPDQKNSLIRKELRKIRETPFEDFKHEIYEVKSTFGVSQSSGLARIQNFIGSEIKKMDWYYHNEYNAFARAIPSYIVGYSLFNYSMPKPMRDLFNLYYQITQSDYFKSLGIKRGYMNNNKLSATKIKKKIKKILSKHAEEYPHIQIDVKRLEFQDVCMFSKTYLLSIKKMNFERRDLR
jgi:hypothetical protein